MARDDDRKPEFVKDQPGERVSLLRVGNQDLYVLSLPSMPLDYPEGATEAEREVIDCIFEGLSAREIAARRKTSKGTVDVQLGAIFKKAGVNSQSELIAQLLQAGKTKS